MSDNRQRCKIDTAVLDKVEKLVLHFSRSVQVIHAHINQYLEDVSADFAKQLEAIEQRLVEAEEEETRRKEEKEKAKEAWDTAVEARKEAERALDVAIEGQEKVEAEFNPAKVDLDSAHQDREEARACWKKAKEEQQDAYDSMKSGYIDHDTFEEYMEDTKEKKAAFFEKQDIFNEKKAVFDAIKTELVKAKSLVRTTRENLNAAKRQETAAKKAYYEAEERYEAAVKNRQTREANLKDAKEIVTKFKLYKDAYFHPFILLEADKSCDVILTQLSGDMIGEFGQAMKEIRNAVIGILRCSLVAGVESDSRFLVQPTEHKKTWEERQRLKDGLISNRVRLNQEMNRPEYEKPDYAERCKVCGRLLSLCICPRADAPDSLDD